MEYRIRPPSDSTFGPARTYFTEYDPVVQEWYHGKYVPLRITDKLKILSLMHDTVTVAAAHLIRSGTTFRQLADNSALLEEGVVVPAINDDFDSFVDMVDRKSKADEYTRPWLPNASLPTDELYERAEFLDDHAGLVMGWDLDVMRGGFRRSLLRDLSTPESALHDRLSRTVDVERLRRRLASVEPFSRKGIVEATAGLPRRARTALFDAMNVNYHLTGATVHRATPNVHAREVDAMGDKFRRAVDFGSLSDGARDELGRRVGRPGDRLDREVAFREFLTVADLDGDPIRRLDAEDVVELRDLRVTRRFREALTRTLESVNDPDAGDGAAALRERRAALREEIANRVDRQRRTTGAVRRGLKAAVYASGLGALLAGAEAVDAALDVTDPVLDWLVETVDLAGLLGNEFLAFEQRFVERTDADDG